MKTFNERAREYYEALVRPLASERGLINNAKTFEIPRTKGYTDIVKIAEAALQGDKEKAVKHIRAYLIKYPESDLVYPFTALLNRINNPSGLGHHDLTEE